MEREAITMSDEMRKGHCAFELTLRQSRIFELPDFGNLFTFLSFVSSSVMGGPRPGT